MEFNYSSDDEETVAYDDYQHTPLTDPSRVKKLWGEHFKRDPKDRNKEVTSAFKIQCSLFKFMYPDLSRKEIRSKVMESIGVSSSSVLNIKSSNTLHIVEEIVSIIRTPDMQKKSPDTLNELHKSKKNYIKELKCKTKPKKCSNRLKITLKEKPNHANAKTSKSPKKRKSFKCGGIEKSNVYNDSTQQNSKETNEKKVGGNKHKSNFGHFEELTISKGKVSINLLKREPKKMKTECTFGNINLSETCTTSKYSFRDPLQDQNEFNDKSKTYAGCAAKVVVVKVIKKTFEGKSISGKEHSSVQSSICASAKADQENAKKRAKPKNRKSLKRSDCHFQSLTSLGIVKFQK